MIEKFSVRKPFTVIVAIILVFILGAVSFTKMKTDLLPNMNLPYAMVMTTYAGASSEEIEGSVTKPIEQALSSISGLSTIASQSKENISIVTMEFEDDTNMDAAMLSMRENLDMIKSSLPEKSGNPTIMKLSMNMMPALVTAIDSDKLTPSELTQYVETTLAPSLESVEGVASVTTTGLLEEKMNVLVNEDKINALNDKVKNAINGKFDKTSKELEEAENKINVAKSELDSKRTQANEQISKAKKALNDASLNATQKEIQVTSAKMSLEGKITEAKMQQAQLRQAVKKLESQYAKLKKIKQHKTSAGVALKKQIDGYKSNISKLSSTVSKLNGQVSQMSSALSQIKAGKTKISSQLETLEQQSASASGQITSAEIEISKGKSQIEASKKQIESARESALKASNMKKTITVDMVKKLLEAQDFEMPAGYVTENNVKYLVRVGDEVKSQEELENLYLMDLGIEGLDPIRLKDVADVAVTNNLDDLYCKVNGNNGVMLTIQKQSNYSASEVSKAVTQKLKTLKKTQKGLHSTNLMDQGVYIDIIVKSVLENLVYGAIFAIIVLFLFLKDVRPTLVVSLSIPISVVFAIVLMYFTGITLNIISLSGLALGVGMLVDNSIVVIENIYRLRKEGFEVKEAAVEGARGVGGAIIASTLTTVSVFLPIVFTTGLTRELFSDMGLTIAFSLIASLIVAITVVPMMASGLLSKVSAKENKLINKIRVLYEKVISKLLHFRLLVIVLSIVLLAGGIYGIGKKGFSLFPDMDSTQMSMTITMPKGASQQELVDMTNAVTDKVMKISDVKTIGSMQQGSSGNSLSSLTANSQKKSVNMYLILKEEKKLTNKQIKKKIEKATAGYNCELSISTSNMDMGSMAGSGVSIAVKGTDLSQMRSVADQIAQKMQTVKGLEEISNGQEESMEEIHITVDKEKAIKNGLTVAQVYQAVATELADASSVTELNQENATYDITIQKSSKYRETKNAIENLQIIGTVGQEDKTVSLNQIATVTSGTSLSTINRKDQTRYITVSASVKDGYNATKLNNKVEKLTKKIELPKGITLETNGEAQSVYEMMKQLILMLVLAIVFMYLIMVAQFQSIVSPFIILFTIPLAFTGGLFGLLACNKDLSVIAMIGFVMLSGIIVNNGIVLVDTINQLREKGYEKNEAIVEAGSLRLRPIFMTALTTILGLSTMAIGIGSGSDMVQPMAIVTIGGLTYGTLLTLIVIPCIYSLVMREKRPREERRSFKIGFRRKSKKQVEGLEMLLPEDMSTQEKGKGFSFKKALADRKQKKLEKNTLKQQKKEEKRKRKLAKKEEKLAKKNKKDVN